MMCNVIFTSTMAAEFFDVSTTFLSAENFKPFHINLTITDMPAFSHIDEEELGKIYRKIASIINGEKTQCTHITL